MRLYVDTADRAAAEPLLATGLFAGLTTNPTILSRASKSVTDIPDILRWARAAGAGEVFFQAWGPDAARLVDCGLRLRELGDDVVVKLVATQAGATACAELTRQGVPTLLTAVYNPAQALVAAAAGATYIAPYLAKLHESGRDGIAAVQTMHEVLTATGSKTRVLLASLRDVDSMVALARHGVSSFTMNPSVAGQLFVDPLTAAADRTFDAAIVSMSVPG